jgi:TctA family transporter
VVTVIDGYGWRQGRRAGAGGGGIVRLRCVGTLVLAACRALTKSPSCLVADIFPMILGLIGAVVLASGSLLKAFGMIVLGLLLGIVGPT